MKKELERLRTLVEQLVARLQMERDERVKLENQLKVRQAELEHTRTQLADLRRKQAAIISQLKDGGNA